MFGDRAKKYTQAAKEAVGRLPDMMPERLSLVHRAGIILFAGLLHGAVYKESQHAEERIADIQETAANAATSAKAVKWALKDLQLKAARNYRQNTSTDIFPMLQQDILRELSDEETREISTARVLGHEEYFVEGIPITTIERGMIRYDELVKTLREMRANEADPSVVSDEILNAMLAERGRYVRNQPSMYALLAGEGGNCVARAKLAASLLEDVYPEFRNSGWIRTELYRGYEDAAGEKHGGHIRVVLDFEEGDYTVMEGSRAYATPRRDDNVPRPTAYNTFVRGSAAAMGIVEGGESDMYKPQRLVIKFPDSPIAFKGRGDGEVRWWPGQAADTAPPKTKEIVMLPVGVDVLDEAISDEALAKFLEQKKERNALGLRMDAFLTAHENEGVAVTESQTMMTGRQSGSAKAFIVPLDVSASTRAETEDLVAALRRVMPEARSRILYGVTSSDQKLLPLSDPDANYLFLSAPTKEQLTQLDDLSLKRKVILVKNVDVALRERSIHPAGYALGISDPITSLHELQTANGLSNSQEQGLVSYVLDLPDAVTNIPLSGYVDCLLKRPTALEGKTLDIRGSLTRVLRIHGALPNIYSAQLSEIAFSPDLSASAQNTFVLGHGTEIVAPQGITINFYGSTVVREGWTMDAVSLSDKENGVVFIFWDKVSFSNRAFSGIQRRMGLHVGNTLVRNIDQHAFDGLEGRIAIVVDADDGTYVRQPWEPLDPSPFEQRLSNDVQFPQGIVMEQQTAKNNPSLKYLFIAPLSEVERDRP